jgi:hypothetical protein
VIVTINPILLLTLKKRKDEEDVDRVINYGIAIKSVIVTTFIQPNYFYRWKNKPIKVM